MTQPQELSTEALKNWIESPLNKLVDIRPIAAYNGWQLQGEKRGGHIEGAMTFPKEWTRFADWTGLLHDKGVTVDTALTIYGYHADDTRDMADKLEERGYRNVFVYNHFIDEWSANPDLPMEQLQRYQQLVYPGWVHAIVTGNTPPDVETSRVVICHAHYNYKYDYDAGHIPGAIPIDTVSLEDPEDWNRYPPEELEEVLLNNGITHDKTVVLYGRFSYPDNKNPYPGKNAGHLGAIRCALIMLYAGVKDVRILNGGLAAWEVAGYELSTEQTEIQPEKEFGVNIPLRPDVIVDMPKAKELLASDDGELVSMRSWEEFIGNVSGYHYIRKAGRIPGAIFGNCGSDAYHMENYRNPDHTMREYHEIEANWAQSGIVPEKHIAFYCGTGWRASEAFWNAYLMGWPRVSVFDGGWLEWSEAPSNPVEIGDPVENETAKHTKNAKKR